MIINKKNLKSATLSYIGPKLTLKDLRVSREIRAMIKVSQTLYSDRREDEKCFMYPVLDYNSFADCDEDYVYNELNTKCDLVPFWTARDNENVTSLK